MPDIAEKIPSGPSVKKLQKIASKNNIAILAGLFEKDDHDNIYKAQVCVDKNGLIAKFRKLHPFINPNILPGNEYCVFDLYGWKCGILICYDNNIIENVRATTLLERRWCIFTRCMLPCVLLLQGQARVLLIRITGSIVKKDPTSLRLEFDGLKGRAWLMKWLPARAYDNAVYVVFSNPIGMDDDQLKNGCSMILDPYGDVIAECRELNDQVVSAALVPEHLKHAGGFRYIKARRPALYKDIIGSDHKSEQKVVWQNLSS